jgi:hypothetical protein
VLDEFGEVLHVLRFAGCPPGEAGCGACYVDLSAQRRVRAVVDEIAVAQGWVTESDLGAFGERVASRDGENKVVVAELEPSQPGLVNGAVDVPGVRLS